MGLIQKTWQSISSVFTGGRGQVPRYGGLFFQQMLWTKPDLNPAQLVKLYVDTAYYCANLNARAVASTPFKIYVITRKGQAEPRVKTARVPIHKAAMLKSTYRAEDVAEVMDHPLLSLLSTPIGMDGYSFLEATQLYLEIVGAAYWEKIGQNLMGQPENLKLLFSQHVSPHVLPTDPTNILWYDYYGGESRQIPVMDVVPFLVKSLVNPFVDFHSPLHAALMSVMTEECYARYTNSTLMNRARPDAIISPKVDGGYFSEPEARRIEQTFNSKFRGDGAGGVFVARDSAVDVHPLSFQPKDIGEIMNRDAAQKQIARAFDVPLSMLDKDSNRASATEGRRQHLALGVHPRCRRLAAVVNRYLCPLYSDRIVFEFMDPLECTPEYQMEEEKAMHAMQAITPNEIRARHGFAPIEGGDRVMLPNYMVPAGSQPVPTGSVLLDDLEEGEVEVEEPDVNE